MLASIKQKFTTPRGHGMTGEDTTTAEIPDCAYCVDDVVWLGERRLVVVGREWRGTTLTIMCTERVQMRDGDFDAYCAERARKGRAA